MTSYLFRFDDGADEQWERALEFATDTAAKIEARLVLENQARVAHRPGVLSVERRAADADVLIGAWAWLHHHAEWTQAD